MRVVAREYSSSEWIEIELRGGLIQLVRAAGGPAEVLPGDSWVAPAFWDIQVNGRDGRSFSSPELTAEQAAAIIVDQGSLGTAWLCPTLITAPLEHMRHGLRTIAEACNRFSDVARRVVGIHIEGPFLSEADGYRGAHSADAMQDPSWALFETLQEAAGGRIKLITLAPERTGSIDFIRRATEAGVVVALGHTAASGSVIREAALAGARLSTHLGNGIASLLPRHPNPIWEQAALESLCASFIADGHHLDRATLRVLARAKGPARTILVSDASPLAGLPPGRYGEWAIEPNGRIVVADTPYLAGSNADLATGVGYLLSATGWTIGQALAAVTSNPARLLGRAVPSLDPGSPGNLVFFRLPGPGEFVLTGAWIDGEETVVSHG
jgi:N-acetylglucosamine-6-phosphate deacetylase